MRLIKHLFIVVAALVTTAPALADGTEPPADGVDITSITDSLGSIAGITAVTGLLVEVLKRALANVAAFQKVPTWLYAVVTSAALTLTASLTGILEGDLASMLWAAVMSAALASGVRSWITNINRTPEDRKLEQQSL